MMMFWIAVMGLAGSAALAMAQAAEPPNVLRIVREDAKPGKGAAHEKNEMGYVRAFSKTGYPNYIAMEAMTGASQVWFVEAHDSMASLESAFKIEQAGSKWCHLCKPLDNRVVHTNKAARREKAEFTLSAHRRNGHVR
jgi:hypothetical protein